MSEKKEPFILRWSRRKLAARQSIQVPPVAPKETDTASSARGTSSSASPESKTALPPLETLKGLASDYREFLAPQVDETLRRDALKRLFGDPHFNTMDGLDVYIGDYTKSEPIPEAMLKTLEQAKRLVLDDEASGKEAISPSPESEASREDVPADPPIAKASLPEEGQKQELQPEEPGKASPDPDSKP